MASAILTRNNPRSCNFTPKFTQNNINFTRFQNPPNRNPNPNPNSGYRYITFRLDSYSRRELKGLKKRLISDLNRVRILRKLVSSTSMPKNSYPDPPVTSYTGQKRLKTSPAVKKNKKKKRGRVTDKKKLVMRECGQILGKLMKHKHGWVFNSPVDAVALKLFDYHNVVTNPMDLGTIKSKLAKNGYKSPFEFACDVRLTFENAMLYNGMGSNVFIMAERLLLLFEDMFGLINQKLIASETNKETNEEYQSSIKTVNANKREMTVEEKAELADSFLNLELGPEGMDQFMGIVKKGAGLERQGDEIELDLAVLDNETLWELHGFIGRTLKAGVATACDIEEDVDIGEEMELNNLPLIEIDKDVVNGSGSGSDSGSDSGLSSSDSGSGTSYNEQEVNSTTKGVVVP